MSDQLLFDDFFVSDADPGVGISVEFQGRTFPFTIRRGITVAQKEAITQAAVARHFDPEQGKVMVDGLSEGKMEVGIVSAYLLKWPSAKPITLESVGALDSALLEAIFLKIQDSRTAREEEANGPFVPSSGAASEAPAVPASPSLPAASPSVSPATSDSAGDPTPSSN